MAIVRWEPLRELTTLQNEMNRLFGTVFDAPAQGNGGTLRRWMPAMDLVETGDHFVLRADLPGLSEEDVNIEVEDRVLTVSGERKAEHAESKDGYHRVERAFGSFSPLADAARGRRRRGRRRPASTAACSRCGSRSPSSASRARSRSALGNAPKTIDADSPGRLRPTPRRGGG